MMESDGAVKAPSTAKHTSDDDEAATTRMDRMNKRSEQPERYKSSALVSRLEAALSTTPEDSDGIRRQVCADLRDIAHSFTLLSLQEIEREESHLIACWTRLETQIWSMTLVGPESDEDAAFRNFTIEAASAVITSELRRSPSCRPLLDRCLQAALWWSRLQDVADTTSQSQLVSQLIEVLSTKREPVNVLGLCMAVLSMLALHYSAVPIFAAAQVYSTCTLYLDLASDLEKDEEVFLGIHSILLLCRVYGKEESGEGADLITNNKQIIERLIWLLDQVVGAYQDKVLGHIWSAEELMRTLALVATADKNKPYLGDAVPIVAKALNIQRLHPDYPPAKAAVETLAQLLFEPQLKNRIGQFGDSIRAGLDYVEPIVRDRNDIDCLKQIVTIRSAIQQPPEAVGGDSASHPHHQKHKGHDSTHNAVFFIKTCVFGLNANQRRVQQHISDKLLQELLRQGYPVQLCTGNSETLISDSLAGILVFPEHDIIRSRRASSVFDGYNDRLLVRKELIDYLCTAENLDCDEWLSNICDLFDKMLFVEMSTKEIVMDLLEDISNALSAVMESFGEPENKSLEGEQMVNVVGALLSTMAVMQQDIHNLKGELGALKRSVHDPDN